MCDFFVCCTLCSQRAPGRVYHSLGGAVPSVRGCLIECDLGTSTNRRRRIELACCPKKKAGNIRVTERTSKCPGPSSGSATDLLFQPCESFYRTHFRIRRACSSETSLHTNTGDGRQYSLFRRNFDKLGKMTQDKTDPSYFLRSNV
jgi:hypothetical protein